MGVYSKSGITESVLNMEDVIECQYDCFDEGAYAIIAETERNYNNIMQAVGIQEFNVFEQTGQEMVYEAVDIKGFISKVKQFFINLWKKIAGLFKKFLAIMDSYLKTDKEFVNKYKKAIYAGSTKDFKYKGFKYTTDAYKVTKDTAEPPLTIESIGGNNEALDALIKKYEDKSDIEEGMRGKAIGESASYTASEFAKELYEKLRNGQSTKEEIDGVNPSEQIQIILGTKQGKKDAEKDFKETKQIINKAIKALETKERELLKEIPSNDENETKSKQLKVLGDAITLTKAQLSIIQTMNSAKLTAIRDNNRQAKAICVKLIGRKAKNESYDFESSYNEGSLIDNVVIR